MRGDGAEALNELVTVLEARLATLTRNEASELIQKWKGPRLRAVDLGELEPDLDALQVLITQGADVQQIGSDLARLGRRLTERAGVASDSTRALSLARLGDFLSHSGHAMTTRVPRTTNQTQ